MPTNLESKWVLITGASSGFGAAAACAFGREGCKLLLGARRVDRLATVAADAKKAGSPAAHVHITQALRLELSGTGVRVGTIDPGIAETEFSVVRFKGDAERAKKVYEGVIPLAAEDIAEALVWAASRPPHVCIDEMLIKCTDQAAIHKVHRRTPGK